MTTMVCFTSAGTAYCLPVGSTRSVRPAHGMVVLPEPSRDVAGIIDGDPPLTVIAPLGGGGEHILVVEDAGRVFGLLVDVVTGLRRVAESDIGQPPQGQSRGLIAGTVDADGQLVLLADAAVMAAAL